MAEQQLQSDTTLNVKVKKITIIAKAKGETVNFVVNDLNSLTIVEDIFSPMLGAKLIIYDKLRLFSTFQFTGNETVEITLASTMTKYEIKLGFVITNYELIGSKGEEQLSVSFDLISDNWKYFIEERSLSFNKNKWNNIAEFIQKYAIENLKFKNVNIDKVDSSDLVPSSIAFPYMTFMDMLKIINQYYLDSDKRNYFLFYTNLMSNNKLNPNGPYATFTTFSSLINNSPSSLLIENEREMAMKNNIVFHKYNLLTPHFMGSKKIKGLGSTQLYFDHKTKEIIKREVGYESTISKLPSLTNYSLFEKEYSNTKENFIYSAKKDFTPELSIIENNILNCTGFSVSVLGLLERTIGQVCTVRFKDKIRNLNTHEQLKGNYLIKSITHYFDNSKYQQIITLIRDGLNYQNNDGLIKLTKVNNKEIEA